MKTDKLPDLINAVSGGEKVFPTFQPLIHEEDPPWNVGELIPERLPDLNRGLMADHHVVAHRVYSEAEFKALPGVLIAEDIFSNNTLIYLDPASGIAGGVTLTGVFDASLSLIMVETM